MDNINDHWCTITFASWLLTIILDANQMLLPVLEEPYLESDFPSYLLDATNVPILDTFSMMSSTLHNYRLFLPIHDFSDNVAYWVKPRSTTWFLRFLLEEYDNSRWLSMFRMTKASVFTLADLLKPYVQKKTTKYRLAIPVLIRVACTLFKLIHGANLTICSEMFAIGRSSVCKVLQEVVHAINDTLKQEMSWPQGERLRETQAQFFTLCGLPAVVGAIDSIHVSISKPPVGASDYFYFKSGGYTMNCQVVVDSEKRFLDLYVGMPGSTNDSRMLRRSLLHYLASHRNLLAPTSAVDGHAPFLIGDLGYPLLPWLMVPHRGGHHLSISELLFKKKLQRGRCVVENAFGILKQSFHELLNKSELSLTFLPNVILCCALLHNLLLKQSNEEIEDLLQLLRNEALRLPTAIEGQVLPEDFADGVEGWNVNTVSEDEGQPQHQWNSCAGSDSLHCDNFETSHHGEGWDNVEIPAINNEYDIALTRRQELGIYLTTRHCPI